VVGGVEGAQSCSNPGLLEQIDHNAPVRACKNAEGARATRLPSSDEPANSSKPSRPQHALGMTVMPDALERGSCQWACGCHDAEPTRTELPIGAPDTRPHSGAIAHPVVDEPVGN
jgi:hypothetical protein